MLEKLAIWFLNKKKVSVIMNIDVDQRGIHEKSRKGYFYNTILYNDLKVYDFDGEEFILPKGKFNVTYNNSDN